MVLDRILENKRSEVALRKQRVPETELRSGLRPSDRSLLDALRKPHTGFVLEVKKASPSRGLIREEFDPLAIAHSYAPFTDAISVLTDKTFFQGGFGVLKTVRQHVSQPVLCKDFVVDSYQLVEARAMGADAILIMLSVVDDEFARTCIPLAEELGLDLLVEVHDEEELERALALDARLIGINNRSLKTLEEDLETTRRLAPLVPEDRVVVCESGIFTHAQVREFRGMVDAFLIGTSLMMRPDLDDAIREIIFGPVKVCGLTNLEDARHVHEAGATWGGVILTEKSRRRVSRETARELIENVPLRWAGVFVEQDAEEIAGIASELKLQAVQVHRDRDDAALRELAGLLPEDCELWAVIRVSDSMNPIAGVPATRVLLDTYSPEAHGGTGERFDWSLLEGADLSAVVLAGGLNPDIASEADTMGASILDVNSGVELEPGRKDVEKLRIFFAQLRGTGRGGRHAS